MTILPRWQKQKEARLGLNRLHLSKADIRFWSHVVFQFDNHHQFSEFIHEY